MINKMELSIKASQIRKKMGEDESSPIDILSLSLTISNLTLIFYPLGKNISGACFKNRDSSIIAINSNMSLGRQRFSLAHELYHLFFDTGNSSTICSSEINGENENEKKANIFASYLLISPVALCTTVQKLKNHTNRPLSFEDVIRLEQYFGISHQAMLVRLSEISELSAKDIHSMQTGVISMAAKMGFDTSLYKPTPESKNTLVLGYYISQADKLLQADIISIGKYEELLLDAFRDDIVYGDEEGGESID